MSEKPIGVSVVENIEQKKIEKRMKTRKARKRKKERKEKGKYFNSDAYFYGSRRN